MIASPAQRPWGTAVHHRKWQAFVAALDHEPFADLMKIVNSFKDERIVWRFQ